MKMSQLDLELGDLVRQANGDGQCSADSYVCADDDLPSCVNMDNDNWEKDFFAELGSRRPCLESVEEDKNDDYTKELEVIF